MARLEAQHTDRARRSFETSIRHEFAPVHIGSSRAMKVTKYVATDKLGHGFQADVYKAYVAFDGQSPDKSLPIAVKVFKQTPRGECIHDDIEYKV